MCLPSVSFDSHNQLFGSHPKTSSNSDTPCSVFLHSLFGGFLELSKLVFERVTHLLGQLDRSLLDFDVVLFGVEVCARVGRSAHSSKQEQLTATSTLFRIFIVLFVVLFVLLSLTFFDVGVLSGLLLGLCDWCGLGGFGLIWGFDDFHFWCFGSGGDQDIFSCILHNLLNHCINLHRHLLLRWGRLRLPFRRQRGFGRIPSSRRSRQCHLLWCIRWSKRAQLGAQHVHASIPAAFNNALVFLRRLLSGLLDILVLRGLGDSGLLLCFLLGWLLCLFTDLLLIVGVCGWRGLRRLNIIVRVEGGIKLVKESSPQLWLFLFVRLLQVRRSCLVLSPWCFRFLDSGCLCR